MRQEYLLKKEIVLNKRKLLACLIVLSFFCLFSLSKIILKYIENKEVNTKSYSNKSNIDYTVNVDPNPFITNSIMGSNMSYITSLVNGVNMTVNYELNSQVELPLVYDYSIKATLYGLYNLDPTSSNNPVIWSKEYSIKPTTTVNIDNGNNIKISESFNLDVRSYIGELLSFIENFQIPTIGYIGIEIPITVSGASSDYSLSEKYLVTARITIEDKVFMIEGTDLKETSNYLAATKEKKETISTREVTLYSVSFVLTFALMVITIRKMNSYDSFESYSDQVQGIKDEYKDLLIVTNSMIDVKNFKIISIKDFDELLNLAANLTSPIMLYEGKREAIFYIIKDDIIYLYVFKNREYKKK